MFTGRIALDARQTRQMSAGMKTYVRELTARLPRVAPDLQFTVFDRGGNFGFDEQVRLPVDIRRSGAQLTHFLSLYVPVAAPRPFLLTIHDLIHLRFPEYFKPKVRPYYQTVVRLGCARAHAVITDDERTRDDLRVFLGVDPAKVRVIPLGVEERFFAPVSPYRSARPYVLYVGNHRPHKDLPTLLRAWAALPPDLDVDLYLTGPDDLGGELQRYSDPRRQALALGDVSADKLVELYAGARALVHPALWEGFGLPMLEAMAAGCPVIACSDAVPAVLADTVMTFPPKDVRAAARAMEHVLRDEGVARNLVIQGRARAHELTWDNCAALTANVYREVLEEQPRR